MSFLKKADAELISKIDEICEKRIDRILNSPTEVSFSGKAYYVSESGNDTNDGTAPDKAWKSIERVNKTPFESGDALFFERGGRFRTEEPLHAKAGVCYSAYGSGAKPTIVCSVCANGVSSWEKTDCPNVYRFNKPIPADERDVGLIIFDLGRAWGIKVSERKNGHRLDNGRVFNGLEFIEPDNSPFSDYHDLHSDLEFYHDFINNNVYLYSAHGNPGARFESIELSDKGHGIDGEGKDIVIDNIAVFGTGSHGIGFCVSENVTVQNCCFWFIGGSIQGRFIFDRDYHTRYGNAVQFHYGDRLKIKNCYSSQIFDCCYTVQYGAAVPMTNIEMSGNVAEFCNTGLEIWLKGGRLENMKLHDNITRYCGYGFSNQRPLKDGNFFYGARDVTSTYVNNDVCDNINYYSSCYALLIHATGADQYNFHDNLYIMERGKYLGGISTCPGHGNSEKAEVAYDDNSIKAAIDTGFESGSRFYVTDTLGDEAYKICRLNAYHYFTKARFAL